MHWHLIDYIITKRKDIRDIHITRAMRGADCSTDHMMLRCRVSFRLASARRRQRSSAKKKLDVQKLSNPAVRQALQEALAENLEPIDPNGDHEETWNALRDSVYNTASKVLGHPKKKHKDWFDENNTEILSLLHEKRKAHSAWLSDRTSVSKHDRFRRLRGDAQKKIRQMKDSWWAAKADELQQHADQHNSKKFFEGLKAVYGPPSSKTTPIRDSEGNLLTEKATILERWAEHFNQLLNRPSSVDEHAIRDIPQILSMTLPPRLKP